MKKLLSTLLALCLILALLPAQASAVELEGFECTLAGGEVYITGIKEEKSDVVIPATLNGMPVTRINSLQSSAIVSVTVPSSVKAIGDFAFLNNINMISITLPEGLGEIGNGAFEGCGLVNVVIPESVTTLGGRVFWNAPNLASVKLPSTLTKLPEYLFWSCKSLTSIDIPATVTELGDGVFNSSGLTSLTIPAGVTRIPANLCEYCEALSEVQLPAGIVSIGDNAFAKCPALTSIAFPTTVQEIGQAFGGSGLTEAILPYGVTSCIWAFGGCEQLTALYVPSTVELIHVPANCVAYCKAGAPVEASFQQEGASYLYDASVDTTINVIYNGKRISFGAYGQNPVLENGRTLVPLRSIFEAMGATVEWDQATQSVTSTRGDVVIQMTLGSTTFTVNGEARTLDVAPQLINGRTMVPVRAVAESFGAEVGWSQAAATAYINEAV